MNVGSAQLLALSKMREHGLHDWSLKMNPKLKRTLGRCWTSKRVIELSVEYVQLNEESAVLDTILHEIAHALTPGEGHGPAWKKMCVKIGANPQRCASSSEVIVKRPWQLAVVTKTPLGITHIERTQHFAFRRSDMSRRFLLGRKEETLGKLQWLPSEGV